LLQWDVCLTFPLKCYDDPADIPQSSATSCSVNRQFEWMTAGTRSVGSMSLEFEDALNVDHLWLMFDTPWIFCTTDRLSYCSSINQQTLLATSPKSWWKFFPIKQINVHMLSV
jgi:hypothetical protein